MLNNDLPNSLILNLEKSGVEVEIDKHAKDEILEFFKNLILIREFEKICAEKKREGEIGGPVHLAIGQEAIPVGISTNLRFTDYVFSAHRSHAHLLALKADPFELFAELLGKKSGSSGGFGGSMHLVDQKVGFYGSVPIVAGTVPLALGAAFSAKYKNTDDIAVAYFGDGAIEEGVIHESLNIASMMELPILFVCENNLMASHMHISQRQKNYRVARFAEPNGIPSMTIDGNNVLEIESASREIINKIRKERKPFFIEAITFRHLGHVDWREDIDVGVSRSLEDLQRWKAFDPIIRLRKSMLKTEMFKENQLVKIEEEIKSRLQLDWSKAESDQYPDSSEIEKNVFYRLNGRNHA